MQSISIIDYNFLYRSFYHKLMNDWWVFLYFCFQMNYKMKNDEIKI